MRIGDKVRFLSQTGGGIVVGFDKKGWALVEDSDGFEIPAPLKECVVVEENVIGKEQRTAQSAGFGANTVTTHGAVALAKQGAGAETVAQGKTVQTRGGDNLNVALVYTNTHLESTGNAPVKYAGNAAANTQFECTLANESNYNLLITYDLIAKGDQKEHTTIFAGEVLPYERKLLFSFGKDTLNESSRKVQLRAIPFKRGDKRTLWKPKETIQKEFVLDPVNLLKDSMFKENEYLSGRGYVMSIIKEGHLNSDYFEVVKKELLEKFNNDIREITPPAAKPQKEDEESIVKTTATGVLEVDLHAHELLDTTAGMGNAEILLYQLSKFNEVMVANLHKKGAKIVFIHGKGDGVLRNAVLKELKNKYSRCIWQDASFKEYGFGATMVTIK
ncbi:MAG: DUF2027 domain-containing protein [Bacteroidales bacterium]